MYIHIYIILGLPQWLNGKESAFSAGDTGDMDLLSQGQCQLLPYSMDLLVIFLPS